MIAPPSRDNSGIYGAEAYKSYTYFAIGFYFFCHRLSDGKQMWMKDMPRNIGTILIADDTFFGICQNGTLYAYHAVTGKPLWQAQAGGTTEQLFYMNGVLYYVGGNGLLYAIDGKTGKVLWKRMSPDIEEHSDSGFKGNVVGANGKIYVSSYLNLYCFKAAR
jgi:outer membrane protein assembly factor BamB